MSKRINNVFKKYVKNFKGEWYEDLQDIYDPWGDKDITKEQLETYAKTKIDLFIKELHPKLMVNLKDEKKVLILCWYLRTMLVDNIYNNNATMFSLYDHMFHVPEEMDDHGMFLTFNIGFGSTFNAPDCYQNGEGFSSLIIEAVFSDAQDANYREIFEFRCCYDQAEWQYNENFEKYFNETNTFLTNEDLIKHIGEENIDDTYQDYFEVDIVELVNPAMLRKPVVNKDSMQGMIEEINNVIG